MFSFIRRWLGKAEEKEKDEEAEEVKPYEKGDPIPYSTDFSGASKITISARDCTRENITAVSQSIVRADEITRIVSLLKSLSVAGEQPLQVDPCTEHTLTAYNDDTPFAQVVFYDGHLKLENDLYIVNGDKLLERQATLFSLIEIDVEAEERSHIPVVSAG